MAADKKKKTNAALKRKKKKNGARVTYTRRCPSTGFCFGFALERNDPRTDTTHGVRRVVTYTPSAPLILPLSMRLLSLHAQRYGQFFFFIKRKISPRRQIVRVEKPHILFSHNENAIVFTSVCTKKKKKPRKIFSASHEPRSYYDVNFGRVFILHCCCSTTYVRVVIVNNGE